MTTKFTKIFPLIISGSLLCGISGCSTENGANTAPELFVQSRDSEQSMSTDTTSDTTSSDTSTDSSTTSSTATDSTTESTSDTITDDILPIDVEISGQPFSLPCRFDDIEKISIDSGILSFGAFNRDDGKRSSKADFFYDDIPAGQIYLEGDCTVKENIGDARVIGLVTGDSRVPVTYMGVTFGSGREDVANALGSPVEEDDTYMYYYIDPKGSVTFTLNDEKKVSGIAIFMDIR